MPRISSARKLPRVPIPESGIQVNCCQSPTCSNFQKLTITPDPDKTRRNSGDNYRISGSLENKILRCTICSDSVVLKSNHATYREYRRLRHDLDRAGYTFCTRESYASRDNDSSNHKTYESTSIKSGINKLYDILYISIGCDEFS